MKKLLLLGVLLVSAVGYSQKCTTYTYEYNDYTDSLIRQDNKLCLHEKSKTISINESFFEILKFEKIDDLNLTWLISQKTKELFILSTGTKEDEVYFLDIKNDLGKVFFKIVCTIKNLVIYSQYEKRNTIQRTRKRI